MISNPLDVKACLTRVLALMEDRDAINEDIAKVLSQYKDKGVVPKGIRKVAALQRMDAAKRRNDEEMYADYEAALGAVAEAAAIVSSGGTYQEAQNKTGLSRASVARAAATAKKVSRGNDFETPHDPDTGEIVCPVCGLSDHAEGCPHGTVSIQPSLIAETPGSGSPAGDGEERAVNEAASGLPVTDPDIPFEITGGSMEPLTEEDLRRLKIENDALIAKERDDLTIPDFLRRSAA